MINYAVKKVRNPKQPDADFCTNRAQKNGDYDFKELADDTYRTVPSYIRMIVYNYLRRLDKPDTKQDDWWIVT